MVSAEVMLTVPIYFMMVWTAINMIDWFRNKLTNTVILFETKDREALSVIKSNVDLLIKSMREQEERLQIQNTIKGEIEKQLGQVVDAQVNLLRGALSVPPVDPEDAV